MANHTWDHPHLQGMPEDRFAFQIDHTNDVLESISGKDVVCVRPPYGDARPDTVGRLAAHGLTSVVWSADSADFEKPGVDAIVANSVEGLRNGSIILMHDGGGDPRPDHRRPAPHHRRDPRPRASSSSPVCDGPTAQARPGHLEVAGSDRPEAIHLTGWAERPRHPRPRDRRHPPRRRAGAGGRRRDPAPDGLGGFDVRAPGHPRRPLVCVVVKNVGTGREPPPRVQRRHRGRRRAWYDRMGRFLGLLEGSERFGDGSSGRPPTDPLHEMVDALVPEAR